MAERRAGTKSRRLGSSRRRQLREGPGEAPVLAPSPGEDSLWASQVVQRVQDLLGEQDKDRTGFVTRSDVQKLQEEGLPCSTEELQLLFDGLDAAGSGRISIEEFTAGLRQFLSSHKAARHQHRRRKTASQRVHLVLPSPELEGVDSEEQKHFAAFLDQLGMDNTSEEQQLWQLWVKLRQEEPQLRDKPEDFLAEMRLRIQGAKSKEALEVTLNKRVAEHDLEVQQFCQTLEQQLKEEGERLEQESGARRQQHRTELQQALDAGEREVQRLITAQRELEARCHRLCSTQQAANTENQQLEESNQVLEEQLQHLHQQLQQTHRHLQATRATVAWEEPGDRAGAELPRETPMPPQMSLEKQRSEMRIRLGSQSSQPKSTHQVVWEVLPAEKDLLGGLLRASSMEEESFPEFLKEEGLSGQSSLLREMNDAIAALSKQLKPQALGAAPTPTDTAQHPQDDTEPQTGLEAAAAQGTTPEVWRETVPSHVGGELLTGELRQGPVAAEPPAPGGTQAGASLGAGHHRAEQGEGPEEAWKMLFLQGEGPGVKELRLKEAEHLRGAPGESMEGEQMLVEVEGEGWTQGKTVRGKAQPPGEAEEEALSQGENPEAGLGPPQAGQAGPVAGWQLVMDELGPAAGQQILPLGLELGEETESPSGTSEKPKIELGGCPEPEPPSWGEAQKGAAQGEMTVVLSPRVLEEEQIGVEVQTQEEASHGDVQPAPAQHRGNSRAGAEEEEVEVTQPREAEPQPRGESGGVDAAGRVGAEVLVAVPPADVQEGGADVQLLEAQSSGARVQLPAELQPPGEPGVLGAEQAGSMDPDVQPLEKDEPESGLEGEMGTAVVDSEGPSPAETPVESPDLSGQSLVKAQALKLQEAKDSQADKQLLEGTSPEGPPGGGCEAAMQLMEATEDGAQGQSKPELLHEPEPDLQAAGVRQGGAITDQQPLEEAEILHTLQEQSTDAKVQLVAETEELKLTPGGSTEADLHPLTEPGSLGTEQEGSIAPDVQPLDQVCKAEMAEMEAEDALAEVQLEGGLGSGNPWGRQSGASTQLKEEDEGQEQDEHEVPQEPVVDLQRAGVGQGEGAVRNEPPELVGILDVLEEQSTGAKVQLAVEVEELKVTPGGSMKADLNLSEVISLDTEQALSLASDRQALDQASQAELVQREAEDFWMDTQLLGSASTETLWGRESGAATQLKEEDEAQEQDEHELPWEAVLGLQRAEAGQGEGAGAGMHPPEEAKSLDVEDQSTDANLQLTAEVEELKPSPGGSMEADFSPLGAAGMQEGRSGLGAAATTERAAGACVPSLAEATLHPEHAAATGQLGLEAMLGPLTGPGGQALEDSQTLGILQGVRGAAEEPLDGAQGLEVVQGERLEAGLRSSVRTPSPGLRQGPGRGVPLLAAPVSEVTLQTSVPKLETLMQEDVLIPDVQLLGASGQAAPRELQEQVSAQAGEVRPHTAPQQLEEKPLPVMETGQAAARPAEPPKQEMPPVPTLHSGVQQKEDAGNAQSGMALGHSSVGVPASSSEQPRGQLLGQHSNDLRAAQRGEKQQEPGQKVSQEGEPSPAEPEAVTAEGTVAAPRGCPEAPLDSDHLYNVLFVGDSHVGKTSFLYRLHADSFNPHLAATVGLDYQVKTLVVDNMHFTLRLWDSAGQERFRSVSRQFFRKADGVVLMYDLTSHHSFLDLRYWLSCVQEGAEDGVAILLLGNKTDCAAQREVPREEGERLAKEHQLTFYECSAASGHNVSESMASLVRLLKVREDELKHKAEEVGKLTQKKKGCCW